MAIRNADETHAYIFGVGKYEGDEVPPADTGGFGRLLHESGIPNPKLVLDNGDVVWGCECWWGPEDASRDRLGDREIVHVSIADYRAEANKAPDVVGSDPPS